MRARNKKYLMMVYSEDERYGTNHYELSFFSDNPAEGILCDIVFGNNVDELMESTDPETSNEGLFYILYAIDKNCFDMESGYRISSGTVERDSICEEIEYYERETKKKGQLETVLERRLSEKTIKSIAVEWRAFYDDPFKYDGSVIVDCINQFINEQ